jgi:transposase
VRLRVQDRRFFCDTLACSKTFAEQFPLLALAYAQRTSRQAESLCTIAYALGGRAGARLVRRLPMPTSLYILLCLIRQASASHLPTPRIFGVNDFAWKKGDRYGTILVDLEAHHVVDVLPDREAETVFTWLKTHPVVQVISRDQAGNYADGARRGPPQAMQVVDRLHLLLNLTTALLNLREYTG